MITRLANWLFSKSWEQSRESYEYAAKSYGLKK